MENKQLVPHSKGELLTSGKSKDYLTPPTVNSGMAHTINTVAGKLAVRGLSRTQAEEVIDPTLGKVNGGEAITPLKQGHYNGNVAVKDDGRALDYDRPHAETHDATLGAKVLAEGKLSSGK